MTTSERADLALRALALLDLTNLDDGCTTEAVDDLCRRAETARGPSAAVCVWPAFVARARERLKGTEIRVATVANFPAGTDDVDETVAEARRSAFSGAHEIDLVFPYRTFIAGDHDKAIGMISAVRDSLPENAVLKVILETGEIAVPELVRIASVKAIGAGAQFLKTSTGKVPVNATPEAARIMIEAIRDSGRAVGFKAAGGIRSTEDAGRYLAIADDLMGREWASPETFRFGASGVLADLLSAIDGGSAETSSGY